ncbi:hypothetical protein [Amycolatopsis sp. 3B14]|uniref:hypothetical protein n=1 Tax=Amycolatopsis sp. 3B14 TaxID=3243600 RepID=UPI003D9673D8
MPHFVPDIGHDAAMKIIRGLGLVYAVPVALLVAGAAGWLGYGEGAYLAAFVAGAVLTPAVLVRRRRPRALPTALATVVLVAVGLLPVWIR